MLELILALNVGRDAEVMFQDTVLQQAFFVDGFVKGSGQYILNISSGTNYIAVSQNIHNLNFRTVRAYNPNTGLGISIHQTFSKFVVELIDFNSNPPSIVKAIEYLAPSNNSPSGFVAKACQNEICIALNFFDPNTGNTQSHIYRIDASGNSTSITTIDLNGSPNIDLFTFLSYNALVFHINPTLISDADTLKVFDLNGNLITTQALVNGGNGAKLLGLMLYSELAENYLGILYTDGTDIVARRYNFNTNSWNAPSTYTPMVSPSTSNPTGIQGSKLVCLNGVGTGFPEVVVYDVFLDFLTSAPILLSGPEDVPDLVIGADTVAIIHDDGLNKSLAISQIGGPTISLTNFATTGTMYSLLGYSFNDITQMLDRVQIAYIGGANSDSIFFFEMKTSMDLSDTFAINAPISLFPFDMVFFEDNNLYASIYPTGMSVSPYIVKLDPSLNLLWRSDTVFGAIPYLPSYLYDPIGSLRSLDKNAGNLTGNTYSVPSNLFKKVVEYNSKAYVVYGDNANNLTVDELDPVNLTVISSNDLGFTVPPVTTVEHSGNYLFISYDNSGQGVVYTYDLTNTVLNGPRTFNYETGSALEIASNFTTDGTNLFYRTNFNHIEKCDLALTTCTSVFVDTLTYGMIVSLVADGNTLFVFANDVENGQHYILKYDYSLNLQNSYGPFPGLATGALNVNEYVAYANYQMDPSFGIVGYLNFVRKQDPGILDWADTLIYQRIGDLDIHEYSPGQYHIYVSAFNEIYGLTHLYRYNVTEATGYEERVANIRYILRDGKLMIVGNGDVSLKLYDVSGRLITSFKGRINGVKKVADIKTNGIYILRLNNKAFKVLNVR